MKYIVTLLLLCLPFATFAEYQFAETLIYQSPDFYSTDVVVADIDQDGDQDLIVTEGWSGFGWWENDGTNTFTKRSLTGDLISYGTCTAADLDSDGDMDIVTGGYSSQAIDWWENDGSQNFTQHHVGGYNGFTVDVNCVDMDNDGDIDIVASGQDSVPIGYISWWENRGVQGFTRHDLFYDYEGPPISTAIGDVDGDGDLDILSSRYIIPTYLWYNNGNRTFTQTPFNYSLELAKFADVNGDGDIDIVGCKLIDQANYDIVWYEHGYPPVEHTIGPIEAPNELWVCDMDTDHDMDIVCSSESNVNGVNKCWENVDGFGGSWSEVIFSTPYENVLDVFPADMDGDGDLDIAGTTLYTHLLVWWELLGTPEPPTPVFLSLTPASSPLVVEQGGSFEYAAVVRCNRPGMTLVDFWTEAVLPSGYTYGPIWTLDNMPMLFNATLEANHIFQEIPSFAPLGTYTFRLNAGMRPGYVAALDEFTFDIIAPTAAPSGNRRWSASGYQALAGSLGNVAAEGTPAGFALLSAYPNPFNATITISITLPEPSDLSLTVHNTLGQQVAELAHGSYSAGQHSFTLDGSSLASGIYFVHASCSGTPDHIQKTVLMK